MSSENATVMRLLDEFEELIENASKVPFSNNGFVDIDEATSIVNDIRQTLPKDLSEAEWIRHERDRIIEDAKAEYNKIIMSAKDQAEYLIENDVIEKEAEKRAQALLTEAENHSKYMKLRAYEYVDKLLYDMQNEIASVATSYLQPMNDQFNEIFNGINNKVQGNRLEMRELAERVQGGDTLVDGE